MSFLACSNVLAEAFGLKIGQPAALKSNLLRTYGEAIQDLCTAEMLLEAASEGPAYSSPRYYGMLAFAFYDSIHLRR